MSTRINPGQRSTGFALFALGFRPFFLAAGLFGMGLLGLWLGVLQGVMTPGSLASSVWHGHEMLFGYTVAVIAGFLLTAVQNWTGKATPSGTPLALLFLLWLAGRLAFFVPGLQTEWVATLDLAFLPVLAGVLARPLLQTRQLHNYPFPVLLLLLTLANALVHAESLGWTTRTASLGLQLAVYVIVAMIAIIGGRVIPFFIESRIKGAQPRRGKIREAVTVAMTLVALAASLIFPTGLITATFCGLAALLHLLRLAGWHDRRLWSVPLLWVLVLGYGWIVFGFLLLTLTNAGLAAASSSALHAFTVGSIGVLTLGMMARVSLGHTGRPMQSAPAMALAFAAINLSALLRVLMPLFFPQAYLQWLEAAGVVWVIAFGIFVALHTPMLLRPRVDGKPG